MADVKVFNSGIRVVTSDLSKHPCCPHGPTILFERVKGEKYFACSASRNRKGCPFYMLQDTWNKNKGSNQFKNLSKLVSYSYDDALLMKFQSCSKSEKAYCHSCNELFIPSTDINFHDDHEVFKSVDCKAFKNPSKLLKPLEDNKKEAQFLFSKQTVDFIMKTLNENKIKNVVCIGTPSIHERIQEKSDNEMKSILLDLDSRHGMFYPSTKFLHYNMFNHHFFKGKSDIKMFKKFLQNNDGQNTCFLMDPPFGGRLELISSTLKTISSVSSSVNNMNSDDLLPTILIMPYFMEAHVTNHIESLQMSDYQIEYENHNKFKNDKNKQKSVVRMFTNIPLDKIPLPTSEGYKFCKSCKKFVGVWNKHCNKCKSCTGKDSVPYNHCDLCNKCIKSTWKHCEKCARCHLDGGSCVTLPDNQICFHCNKAGHKKVNCPLLVGKKRKLVNVETGGGVKKSKSTQ